MLSGQTGLISGSLTSEKRLEAPDASGSNQSENGSSSESQKTPLLDNNEQLYLEWLRQVQNKIGYTPTKVPKDPQDFATSKP